MTEIPRETIIRAAKGDIESFEMVYRVYSGLVYSVALRILNNQEDAQEVTQEVFMTIYRKLKTFRFQSKIKTWIYRISINLSLNRAKKNARGGSTVEFDDNQEFSTVAPSESHVESHTRRDYLAQLLGALSPDQRACLVLRGIEGLSYQEISEVLKININTVRSRLKRAREKLMTLRKEVTRNELS